MTATASDLQNALNHLEIATVTCTGNVVVKVIDVQGRIAKTIRQHVDHHIDRLVLNVEDLCKGKYIINIFSNDLFVRAVHYTKN